MESTSHNFFNRKGQVFSYRILRLKGELSYFICLILDPTFKKVHIVLKISTGKTFSKQLKNALINSSDTVQTSLQIKDEN